MLWEWMEIGCDCIHFVLIFFKGTYILDPLYVSYRYALKCDCFYLPFSCRWNHRVSQYHQGKWRSFAVLSLTFQLKWATRLEGGPTEGWRPMSSTPLMFAALHPIWPALWFWSASYHQWESQWVVMSGLQTLMESAWLHCYSTCLYQYNIIYTYTVHPVSISPIFLSHFSLLWTTSHTSVAAFLCCVWLPPLYSI